MRSLISASLSFVPVWVKSLLLALLLILMLGAGTQALAGATGSKELKSLAVPPELSTDKILRPLEKHDSQPKPGGRPDARPLLTVTISGPQNGIVNTAYTFTATVSPANTKPPIGFIWNAIDQNTVQTIENNLTHSVSFTWETTGTKRITVTVKNVSAEATAQYVLNIGIVSLESVEINGPTTGITGADYTFSAEIDPVDASVPITFSWSPTPNVAGQETPVATYNFTTSGIKNIMVVATNAGSSVTDSHAITIGIVVNPIEKLTITGPKTGTINGRYVFTSTITPPDATPLIGYEWSPPVDNGQGTSHALYHWEVTGTKFISVTATNAAGSATGLYTVTILAIPVQSVDIDGEKYPIALNDYPYHAEIDPIDASLPITYTWWPTPSMGQDNSDVTYNWETGGGTTILVTATNSYRVVTSSYSITVAIVPIPLQIVDIEGPSTGIVNTEYTFTATVNPDATQPILYDWSPTPNFGQGFAVAKYSWSKPGTYTVSVTAMNYYSLVLGTYTVTIGSPPHISVHLPLLLRNWCSFVFWECEPNNTYSSANGPLISGGKYHGYPTDDYDCFYFNMPVSGHMTVEIHDYTISNTQLLLVYQVDPITYNLLTYDHEPPLELDWDGNAGKYVTCLFTNSNFLSQPYTLEVVYPVNQSDLSSVLKRH